MKLFIVVKGGVVQYVSSDTDEACGVTVIDRDDLRDGGYGPQSAEIGASLDAADALPRIW